MDVNSALLCLEDLVAEIILQDFTSLLVQDFYLGKLPILHLTLFFFSHKLLKTSLLNKKFHIT